MLISSAGSVANGRDGRVDRLRLEERLVSLDVDDQIAVERRGDFGEPIGAALMRRDGHDGFAAERSDRVEDALVVGRDDHPRRPNAAAAARR